MGHPVLNHEINSQGNLEDYQRLCNLTVKRKKTTKYIIGNNAFLKKKMRKAGKYFTNQLNIELFLGKMCLLLSKRHVRLILRSFDHDCVYL